MTPVATHSSVGCMKRMFYALALVVAVALIILGVKTSRQDNTSIKSSDSDDSFNAEELQDADEKTPATN